MPLSKAIGWVSDFIAGPQERRSRQNVKRSLEEKDAGWVSFSAPERTGKRIG